MALTNAQIKELCDAIWNNGNPDTQYVNQGDLTAIIMYMNEISKTADILKRDDINNEYIIAILQKENHPYTDSGEIKFYSCKDIKDADLTSVDLLKEYNEGISQYIPMKRYIRDCCAFLGVFMDEDFDSINPVIYQGIIDIVKKYTGLNNKGLAYTGRYGTSSVKYLTFVPVNVLVDIGIYLNQTGLFTESVLSYKYPFLKSIRVAINSVSPSISDIFNSYYTKNEFYNFLKEYYYYSRTNTTVVEAFEAELDLFFNMYGDEIDWNNDFVTYQFYNNGDRYFTVYVTVFPRTCIYNFTNFDRRIINIEDDFTYTAYIITNNGNQYFPTKTVYNVSANTIVSLVGSNWCFFNAKVATIKAYTNNTSPIKYSSLSLDTQYQDLKVVKPFMYLSPKMYALYRNNDIEINDKDLVFIFGGNSSVNDNEYYDIFVVKNYNTIEFKNWWAFEESKIDSYVYRKGDTIVDYLSSSSYYNINSSNNATLNFDIATTVKEYIVRAGALENSYTYTGTSLNISTTIHYDSLSALHCVSCNLGEFVFPSLNSLEGLEKNSGAIYPDDVVDINSFIAKYTTSLYAYNPISNPYYEDGELVVTQLHNDAWINCPMTKEPLTDQQVLRDFTLDDYTPEDEIDKTIDASTNGDDEEDDPLSDDETNQGDNEGDSTIPTIDDVFKYNMSQFQTQWLLSEAEFQALGLLINSGDFLQSIATVIAGLFGIDPLSGIVSVQVAPTALIPTVDTTLKTMIIRGIEMTGNVKFSDTGTKSVTVQGYTLAENVKEFDLGEKEISPLFNSYMDLVDTQMTLYLPFVGNIDLDIRDFYEGSIWIKGFVESFTGQIVYYIISKKDNQTRLISTLTGNCYSNIPLNQDAYGSFMNSFTRG